MQAVFAFLLLKILELSRFNINTNFKNRSFYNLLSLAVILVIGAFFYLRKNHKWIAWEERLEALFCRKAAKGVFVLDGLVIISSLGFSVKMAGLLYSTPLYCQSSDMLPMLRQAGEIFLSGGNPFLASYCPWSLPFTYLPMMLISYLPGVLLRVDIRFISFLSFLVLLIVIYVHHKRKGRPVTGFLLFLTLITSGLFPFFLLSIQTFPFLLLFFIVIFSLMEGKERVFFFSLALTLAVRRIFWLLAPMLIVHYLKKKSVRPVHILYFLCGLVVGYAPALLYPRAFLSSQVKVFQHFSHMLKSGLYLENSLGMAHYLYDYRVLTITLQILLIAGLYLLALRFIKNDNVGLFLALTILAFLYCMRQARPEEYYFLPLVVILSILPYETIVHTKNRQGIGKLPLLVSLGSILILWVFPYLSSSAYSISPIRQDVVRTDLGFESSHGYLEISLGRNFILGNNQGLQLSLRRMDFEINRGVLLRIHINEKECFSRIFTSRKILVDLDMNTLKKFCYTGSNYLEVELDPSEAFFLKILPLDQ